LLEDLLLNTSSESTVEQRGVLGIGGGDLVIGLDVLLEDSAAAKVSVSQQ